MLLGIRSGRNGRGWVYVLFTAAPEECDLITRSHFDWYEGYRFVFGEGALVESLPLWLSSLVEDRSKTQLRVNLIATTRGQLPTGAPQGPHPVIPKGVQKGGRRISTAWSLWDIST